ncbi:MAG: DegT/DnrJ/EryC1/StrS family aminotransferase [Alphaproteobacteria bacterium]|nr:DegT/DnrJ/EryC1/StrS family aminotransferase [Alphaproteobacteria bacterium]
MTNIPFYLHDLGDAEIEAVAQVLRTPFLTTGDTVAKFERALADLLGCKHALAVTSCTGAMHMSLLGMDIGPGDEVITTPMSFIATSCAILEAGATPVFVDVEADTGNLDAKRIEAAITSKTKAILPVHLYGLMCDMMSIREVARKHNLRIIEDAAHCVEGVRSGLRPGQAADTACFSFYATKNLTCGEGGALVTNDSDLFERLKLLRLHGATKTAADRVREGYQHWDMVSLGWKYNMSNIEAAILLPQFERLGRKLEDRQQLAALYAEKLSAIQGVQLVSSRPNTVHAHHLYTVWIKSAKRDLVLQNLRKLGVEAVVNYRPIHLTDYFVRTFGFQPGAFPNAERIGEQTISLPFYPFMPREHVEQVAQALAESVS